MIIGNAFTFVEYVKGRGARVDFENRIIHMSEEIPRHRSRVKNLLKKKLREEVEERIGIFSAKLNQIPNGFRIKNQKTAWGSCSSKRNLNFNLRLIFLPARLIDYIVFHEMLHLRYLSHGKRFHAVMRREFGNIKEIEDELANWWHYVQQNPVARLLD